MTIAISLFGGLMLLAGFLLLINPEFIFEFLRNNSANSAIHVIAVVVRVVIGLLLIAQSSLSRFPLTIVILGWIFIIAGFALAVIGRNRFNKLMVWVVSNFMPFGRLAGVMAIAFGGFLIYAFV